MMLRNGTIAATFGALCFLVGCGYSASDICDDVCDCNGCSDREYEDCLDDADREEARIDRAGCSDQLDDYLACASDTGYCRRDDHWEIDCGPESKRLSNCME